MIDRISISSWVAVLSVFLVFPISYYFIYIDFSHMGFFTVGFLALLLTMGIAAFVLTPFLILLFSVTSFIYVLFSLVTGKNIY